jgi:hypothetical protein
MLIEISDGEVLDRLSILEIKLDKIKDEKRLTDIKKEIDSLTLASNIKDKYLLYYKLIYYVNELIWKKTDNIKAQTTLDEEYAKISFMIFELNQQRFRIKDIVNNLSSSNIKEQKSYCKTSVLYRLSDDISIKEALCNCIYLLLQYDNVLINCNNKFLNKYITEHLLSLKENNTCDNIISIIKIPDDILFEINKIIDSIKLF